MLTTRMTDMLQEVPNGSVLAFTTNGIVKSNGCLVMGAGAAKQVLDLFPRTNRILGDFVKINGNKPCYIGLQTAITGKKLHLVSFPTKHDFNDAADLTLIKESAEELVKLADQYGWKNVYLNAPGTGLGKLDWRITESHLKYILDSRFTIVFKNGGGKAPMATQSQPSVRYGTQSGPDDDDPRVAPMPRKGFLQLASLGKLNPRSKTGFSETYLREFGEKKKLFIVRSPGNLKDKMDDYGLVLVPHLSPSAELFSDTCRWKEDNFTKEEQELMRKGVTHTWWDLYAPRFIEEMRTRQDFQAAIKRVLMYLDQGENIMLICFCGDFHRCHRFLIGYFVSEKGYEVRFD